MTYKIKHEPAFLQKVQLAYKHKKKRMTLSVCLDTVVSSQEAQAAIQGAMASPNYDGRTKALFDGAILSSFHALFGKQATQEILDFFEGNVFEMAKAFTPFIKDVVTPKLEKYALKAAKNDRK